MKSERTGQDQKDQQYPIVKREDTQRSAGIERLEEMGNGKDAQQDAGDQVAGERKKKLTPT